MIWLLVATAAASSVAFVRYSKKNELSNKFAAKAKMELENKEKALVEKNEKKMEVRAIIEDSESDSLLRSKDEILNELDQNMENTIFYER